MHVAAIEAVSRKRRQFEERGAGVEQEVDALPRQHLAAREMALAGNLAAAAGDAVELLLKIGDQRSHALRVKGELRRGGIDGGAERHVFRAVLRRGSTGGRVMVSLRRAQAQ